MNSLPTPGPVQTPPGGPVPPSGGGPLVPSTAEERTFAMLTHLSSLVGYIGVPFGSIIGPLVFWLIKKDTMPFVREHGKEALNFNITVLIALAVSGVLTVILIGFAMLAVVAVFHIVFTIIAAMRANRGELYTYPLTIRFLK